MEARATFRQPAPRPVTSIAPPEDKTVQTMETPYATAVTVQRPRDLNEVERLCLEEAAKAGESIFYAWGEGKNKIEGPSVECARIAARNWGNCAVPAKPVIETPSAYIFTASFVDLERGYTMDREFRQSKNWKVFGQMDEERKADVRFQIGASKAFRNAVLNALPRWLIDHMIERAKQGVREKIQAFINSNGIVKAREMTMRALQKYGVTEDRVAAKFKKKMHEWEIEDLVILKGTISAIESGQETPEVIFPAVEDDPEDSKPKTEAKAGDASTNTGHDNAPKPAAEQVPKDKSRTTPAKDGVMRDEINAIAGTLAFGDMAKGQDLIDRWMDALELNGDLDKLSGDDLRKLYDHARAMQEEDPGTAGSD